MLLISFRGVIDSFPFNSFNFLWSYFEVVKLSFADGGCRQYQIYNEIQFTTRNHVMYQDCQTVELPHTP